MNEEKRGSFPEREITREHYRDAFRSMNSRSSYRIPGLTRISIIYTLLASNPPSYRAVAATTQLPAEKSHDERFSPPNILRGVTRRAISFTGRVKSDRDNDDDEDDDVVRGITIPQERVSLRWNNL